MAAKGGARPRTPLGRPASLGEKLQARTRWVRRRRDSRSANGPVKWDPPPVEAICMGRDERGSERRKFARKPCNVPCRVSSEGQVYEGFVTDISARGIFLRVSAKLAPGTEVSVRFERNGRETDVRGVVSRLHRPHRSVVGMNRPGVGVNVQTASESYFQMLLVETS